MKGQKKIIGKRIISVENYDEYIVAILEDGTKIEISGVDTSGSFVNPKTPTTLLDLIAKETESKKQIVMKSAKATHAKACQIVSDVFNRL